MSDSWPRRRLLAILRGASEPLDAQELAKITGQHVTTVRFHLDVLTRESLVRQFQQPPRGRGRPRIGYRAVQRTVGYQELAQVLADQLGPDPRRRAEAAVAAGRAWGARLDVVEQPAESLGEAKDLAMSLMSELGFAPERDPSGDTDEKVTIRLTACPLRELARTHSEVVCGVHQGLLQEVLDRNGARDRVAVSLDPFVEAEVCELRLALLAVGREPYEGARPAPSVVGGMPPQVRDTDPDIIEQPAQQW
ncbi:helix-turn-helix transcriptional regulator [Nocardia cyriacigeorgica]|uniref:helix-turn-helix transcriptional regulator n=1 Tax=Nocardia cyriacigeorgica TaxID=135487 RepID=UPI0013D442E5|nr:transcriptional regulator [Nocardia cyriacigeorgica]MBF6438818.1 transcriptional regulator [Nocardia cyriacigeorgica]MBF6457273.1 transcriptional regulator [Nocardia cyriacigeorgica]MBF6482360.1 transcriptional regulator [Nocardia cyriacigeorgica]MBF6554456.1 transcriptional regulator [Nocardia cyriacigeorgica]NEW27860.1 transcriptional regulator [Nocardia cyriacigeorgica]